MALVCSKTTGGSGAVRLYGHSAVTMIPRPISFTLQMLFERAATKPKYRQWRHGIIVLQMILRKTLPYQPQTRRQGLHGCVEHRYGLL